jgi:putative sterol carrier protein
MDATDFLMSLPEKVNKAALEGHNTRFHFVLKDTGKEVTLAIADGEITAEEGLVGEAKCVVKSTEENLMKLVNKDLNPMMALLTGKLKISNQSEMVKYAKILGLM